MPKPHERMDAWLESGGRAELELSIQYGKYNRQWAHDKIESLRRWVEANPRKGNKKDWGKFFKNNLSRDWDVVKKQYKEEVARIDPNELQDPYA